MDNGSADGTWEICKSLADEIVVPWKQDFRPYHNGLRADVFNEFRNESSEGDWWNFKLDADEFYYDDPKSFLASVPKKYSLVAKKSLDYILTEEDVVDTLGVGGGGSLELSRIRYMNASCWSEPRFFRYKKNIRWKCEPHLHYPENSGLLYDKKILVKHYQYRSPEQMQKRLDVRNSSVAKKQGLAFRHIKQSDWHELLQRREDCIFDDGKRETYDKMIVRNSLKQSFRARAFFTWCNFVDTAFGRFF
jgi:hypothetical protein